MITLPILSTALTHIFSKGWVNALFELESESGVTVPHVGCLFVRVGVDDSRRVDAKTQHSFHFTLRKYGAMPAVQSTLKILWN